jgi:hypothetical protein
VGEKREISSRLEQAVQALRVAERTIRAWHGEIAWPQYQASPEMQIINAVLANDWAKAIGKATPPPCAHVYRNHDALFCMKCHEMRTLTASPKPAPHWPADGGP